MVLSGLGIFRQGFEKRLVELVPIQTVRIYVKLGNCDEISL